VRAVNLIPVEERRGGSGSGSGPPTVWLLVGLGVLVVAFAGFVLASNQVSERQAKLAQVSTQADSAQSSVAQLKPYVDFASMEQNRTQTVRQLAATRFDWHQSLHDLARVMSKDVWLTSVTGTVAPNVALDGGSGAGGGGGDSSGLRAALPNPALSISGCATSNDEVVSFVSRLRVMNGVIRVSLSDPRSPTPRRPPAARPPAPRLRAARLRARAQAAAPRVAGTAPTAPTSSPSSTSSSSTSRSPGPFPRARRAGPPRRRARPPAPRRRRARRPRLPRVARALPRRVGPPRAPPPPPVPERRSDRPRSHRGHGHRGRRPGGRLLVPAARAQATGGGRPRWQADHRDPAPADGAGRHRLRPRRPRRLRRELRLGGPPRRGRPDRRQRSLARLSGGCRRAGGPRRLPCGEAEPERRGGLDGSGADRAGRLERDGQDLGTGHAERHGDPASGRERRGTAAPAATATPPVP